MGRSFSMRGWIWMAAFPSQISTPGQKWSSTSLEMWSVPWRMWKMGSFFFRDLRISVACLGGGRVRLDADRRMAFLLDVVDRQDKRSRMVGVLLLDDDDDDDDDNIPAWNIGDVDDDDDESQPSPSSISSDSCEPQSLCLLLKSPAPPLPLQLPNVSTVKQKSAATSTINRSVNS